jgi:hypothetical protein
MPYGFGTPPPRDLRPLGIAVIYAVGIGVIIGSGTLASAYHQKQIAHDLRCAQTSVACALTDTVYGADGLNGRLASLKNVDYPSEMAKPILAQHSDSLRSAGKLPNTHPVMYLVPSIEAAKQVMEVTK